MPDPILFIDQYGNIGGGQRSLLALIGIALDAGHRVGVMAPGGGRLEREITSRFGGNAAFHRAPDAALQKGRKGPADLLRILPYTLAVVALVCRQPGYTIRYFNGPRMFLAGFLASFLLPGQSIFHIRIDHSRIEKRLIALIRSSGRNSRVIFNSPYLLRSFLEDTATPAGAGRLSVIENSLYPPFSDRPFVDRFKHTGPRLVIGIFGRICPEKGQDIAGALVNACQAVVIHLVGFCDPADREFLDAILQAGGGRITHRDFSDDLPGTVEELGIQASIVPSRWNEAFGLVAIESMAMSLITFVSDRGMLPEIAAATGALCHESPQRLIEQVAEVCGMNYESRRELARVQHQAAVARYNFNRFAADVTRLLQEK